MLEQFTQEELKQKSMLELAKFILQDANKAVDFNEIYDQIAEMKGFTKKEKDEKVAQFYTELNVDGRFLTPGGNVWGLKAWYPVEQADEQVTSAPKKRKGKKSDDLDELDDEDLDFDDDVVPELGEEDVDEDDEELEEVEEFDDVVYDEDLEEDEEEELDIEIDEEDEDEEDI